MVNTTAKLDALTQNLKGSKIKYFLKKRITVINTRILRLYCIRVAFVGIETLFQSFSKISKSVTFEKVVTNGRVFTYGNCQQGPKSYFRGSLFSEFCGICRKSRAFTLKSSSRTTSKGNFCFPAKKVNSWHVRLKFLWCF